MLAWGEMSEQQQEQQKQGGKTCDRPATAGKGVCVRADLSPLQQLPVWEEKGFLSRALFLRLPSWPPLTERAGQRRDSRGKAATVVTWEATLATDTAK